MLIKVLTYNVHKLFDITGQRYFLSALKDVLSGMQLDLVFLQELPGFVSDKVEEDFDDPLEHLADNLWDHFVYGKNAIYSGGNHGNAIISKYPFLQSQNYDISNHLWEQRGFLFGEVQVNDRCLLLGCTHLDLTFIGRKRQVRKIEQILLVEDQTKPFIFGGDFNDWNGQTTRLVHRMGLQSQPGKMIPTYPSFYPVLSLDRIFFRSIQCMKVEVLSNDQWKKFSDHLPIYAEFYLDE